MTTSTALQTQTQSTGMSAFQPQSIMEAEKLATTLAGSPLMPDTLRGKPRDVFVVLLMGQELGLSVMQAIRGINVIKGKPTLAADLMVALCKRSPLCKYFRLVESTDEIATYETKAADEPKPTKMSFTIQEADQAGLTFMYDKQKPGSWQKYPKAMLRHRSATALARAVYPELVHGIYDPEELTNEGRDAAVRDVTPLPPPQDSTKAPENTTAGVVGRALESVGADEEKARDLVSTAVEVIDEATGEVLQEGPPPDDFGPPPLTDDELSQSLDEAVGASWWVGRIDECADVAALKTLAKELRDADDDVKKDPDVRKAYTVRQGELAV